MKSESSQTWCLINPEWVNAPYQEVWAIAKHVEVPAHFIKVGDATSLLDYEVWVDPLYGLRLNAQKEPIPRHILKNET